MASPYELLEKLQESASKSGEQKLEEEAKRKLAAGEELSSEERQILTYGVDEMQRRKGLKEQIQDRDAQAEKYIADIAKKEEEEKEQDIIKKYQALDLPVPGSDKKEIQAPVGLGPTPDRVYNAPEKPSEAKPTSLLDATRQAQQKTKAPKPADSTDGAPLSLRGEQKAPPAKEPTIQETLQERLSGIAKRRGEAKAERDEKRKRADWGEVASIIGRALAQMGAAAQGMRTGVDMSKAIGPALVDWEKKRDRIDNDYSQEISLLNKESDDAARLADRAQDRQDRKDAADLAWTRKKEAINLAAKKEASEANAKRILSSTKALMAGKSQDLENQVKQNDNLIKDYDRQEKDIADLTTDLANPAITLQALMPRIQKYIPMDELKKDELWGADQLADEKEIIEMLTGKANVLRQARNEARSVNSSLQKGLVKIKSTTPEDYAQGKEPSAPAAPEAPAAPQAEAKNPDVQAYADEYFGGDYDRAYKILKRKGEI